MCPVARRTLARLVSAASLKKDTLKFFERPGGGNHVVIVAADDAAGLHVVEHNDEAVPETFHVVKDDAFLMEADGIRASHGEDLVERADASRQGYDDVALHEHEVLAVAQVIAGDEDVEVGECASAFLYDLRHHADGASAVVVNGSPDTLHEADVATSEDQCVSFLGHPAAHLLGCSEEISVYILIC